MNDEIRALLSAYADRELDPADTARAERLLAESLEARQYVETIRAVDGHLRETFAPVLNEPVPSRIYSALETTERRRYSRHLPAYAALAASVALVAVLLVRQGDLDRQMRQEMALMQQEIALLRHQTLENMPSGATATWAAPQGETRAEIKPLKTYRTQDDKFCREYEERISDADGIEVRRGIACREGKAHWLDLTPVI